MVAVYYCEFLFCDGGCSLFRIRSDWSKTIDHDLRWSDDYCRDCMDFICYKAGKSVSEYLFSGTGQLISKDAKSYAPRSFQRHGIIGNPF